MRELGPRREPARSWPQLLLLTAGLSVPAALLWGAVDPQTPPDQRLQPVLAVLGTAVGLVGVGFGAWAVSAAPRRLEYRLRGRSLEVATLLSRRRISLASVRRAEIVHYDLRAVSGAHMGIVRSHLPGYYVGRWRIRGAGVVRAVVASPRGDGVLLHVGAGAPLLLAPRDPEALVALVERHGGRERGSIRSGS
jgi:hypothetical protein